jgi:hypothetical protein
MPNLSSEGCWCCGDRAPIESVKDWEGRLDGYCLDCALARCDAYAGACGKPKPEQGKVIEERG